MAMSSSESFVIHDVSPSEKDEVDSLPSISSSVLDSEADDEAQAEWERSLEQLQLLLTMVIVPFVGKYFGRKFAYWSKLAHLPIHTRSLSLLRGAWKVKGGKLTSLTQVGRDTWSGCTMSR
jgi:hypothetical protein